MNNIKLVKANIADAEELLKMQKTAFEELLNKYEDYETSPANEPLEKVIKRLNEPFTYFYFIESDGKKIGAVRVVDKKSAQPKSISPLFIMPEYRNHGYAQAAITQIEAIHGACGWEIDTILQEPANCRLYEKMGYCKTGKIRVISPKLTLVYYKK